MSVSRPARNRPAPAKGAPTALRRHLTGINRLLTVVYGGDARLSMLLAKLGYDEEQVRTLRESHLDEVVLSFVTSVHAAFTGTGGERLFTVLCRRYGLDGNLPDTLRVLGHRLGISRERVRQLEKQALTRSRRTYKRRWEAQFTARVAALIGAPGRAVGAPTHVHAEPPIVEASTAAEAPVEAATDDGTIRESLHAILQAVPGGLSWTMLAHILAGDDGPVVRAVVAHYQLDRHLGSFGYIGYRRLADITHAILPQVAHTEDLSGQRVDPPTLPSPAQGVGRPTAGIQDEGGRVQSVKEHGAQWRERLAEIRLRYSNAYLSWSPEQEIQLRAAFESGATVSALANTFQRQPGAIQARLRRMGLV